MPNFQNLKHYLPDGLCNTLLFYFFNAIVWLPVHPFDENKYSMQVLFQNPNRSIVGVYGVNVQLYVVYD